MPIPLEDKFNDIIGKAMRGTQLSDSQVAQKAGVTPEAVHALREGKWDEAAARKVAPVLHLDADALAASGNESWAPQPIQIEGLAQFTTPFEDMTVNSYLVWDLAAGEAAAFDTGADGSGMLDLIAQKRLHVSCIFLTHTHGDHIFDLDRLKAKTGAPAFAGDREPLEGAEPFRHGRSWMLGSLLIQSRLTWGHSRGGITYVVKGLARPVAVVGDAVFAGSMGGGGVSYADALETNKKEILSLPDETVLAPGHGPLTTVGEEKRNNPFFA